MMARNDQAPPALRRAATSVWARQWSGMWAVAGQQAAAGTALGPQGSQLAMSAAGYPSGPDLGQLLHLAAAEGLGRWPLRAVGKLAMTGIGRRNKVRAKTKNRGAGTGKIETFSLLPNAQHGPLPN